MINVLELIHRRFDDGPAISTQSQSAAQTPVSEAFQLLDEYWPNSNPAVMQDISRELEFMERYLLDNRPENPRNQVCTYATRWRSVDLVSATFILTKLGCR